MPRERERGGGRYGSRLCVHIYFALRRLIKNSLRQLSALQIICNMFTPTGQACTSITLAQAQKPQTATPAPACGQSGRADNPGRKPHEHTHTHSHSWPLNLARIMPGNAKIQARMGMRKKLKMSWRMSLSMRRMQPGGGFSSVWRCRRSFVYGKSLDLGVDCALIVLLWRCW